MMPRTLVVVGLTRARAFQLRVISTMFHYFRRLKCTWYATRSGFVENEAYLLGKEAFGGLPPERPVFV